MMCLRGKGLTVCSEIRGYILHEKCGMVVVLDQPVMVTIV